MLDIVRSRRRMLKTFRMKCPIRVTWEIVDAVLKRGVTAALKNLLRRNMGTSWLMSEAFVVMIDERK